MLLLKWKMGPIDGEGGGGIERWEGMGGGGGGGGGGGWTTRKMSVLQATPELCSKLLRCQSIICLV